MNSIQQKIQHLQWRAGFGPSVPLTKSKTVQEELQLLFNNSRLSVPLMLKNWNPILDKEFRTLGESEKAAYRQREKEVRIEINQNFLDRYAFANETLREKMTFFWMGHFACRITNPVFVTKYHNTLNQHALGNFGEMLHAMIRNGALLYYLNNNLNRKLSPNENFARELMELFTLGIGNYTENDVKEGARALTGWTFNKDGEFVIRNEHHDDGVKIFLGEKGVLDGDSLIKIILGKKQCARFIVTKIYRHFVNETTDIKIIESLSDDFFNSGYDLTALMKSIFSAGWFYAPENIGNRIKSPVELLVGIIRNFRVKFDNPMMPVQLQKIMGQLLFDPPNVAGWPSGNAWIDSSRLMYRMRLPELILQEAESIIAPKEEFDALETLRVNNGAAQNKRKIKTTFSTGDFEKCFSESTDAVQTHELLNFLLQCPTKNANVAVIEKLTANTSGQSKILKTAIYAMSLPEYQLC